MSIKATINNQDAANVLCNVATILEMAEDNPYRVRAYRRAARLLRGTSDHATLRLTPDGALDLPGVGSRLRKKLTELLSTGQMRFYVELRAELPDEIAGLMEIPGVGPKTARRLNEELGATTVAEVAEAARHGKIRELYGFGETRERHLLAGAERVLAGFHKSISVGPNLDAGEAQLETLPAPTPLPRRSLVDAA